MSTNGPIFKKRGKGEGEIEEGTNFFVLAAHLLENFLGSRVPEGTGALKQERYRMYVKWNRQAYGQRTPLAFICMAYIATDVISINPSTSFLHNLFCLSH